MIVVTGASGFLGRAVVAALSARGLPVLAVSRGTPAFDRPVQALQVEHYSQVKPRGAADVLLHLAEPRHIGAVDQAGERHASAMRETVNALVDADWASVLYASSAAVYGDESGAPHRADEAIQPRGVYAQAKAACEESVLRAGGGVARLANLYGPGMAENNVLSDILAQTGKAGPVRLRDAKPVRDYLWIEDAARGIADATVAKTSGVFNLGSGIGTSVGEMAALVMALTNQNRAIEETAPAARDSHLVLDIAATAERLGWRPLVPLRQGLAQLLGVPA